MQWKWGVLTGKRRTKLERTQEGHQSLSPRQAIAFHHGGIPTSQVVDGAMEEHLSKPIFHSFSVKSEMGLSSGG